MQLKFYQIIEKITYRNIKALEDTKKIIDPAEIEKAVAAIMPVMR